MQTYTFRTLEDSTRPVIQVGDHLTAVIDTGADIPVCSDAKILMAKYGAVEVKIGRIRARGIGGRIAGKIYVVKSFTIGPLTYPNIKFFVPDHPTMDETFLLSASMFDGMILEIDLKNHYLKVTLPDDEQSVRLVSFDRDGEHICWDVKRSDK